MQLAPLWDFFYRAERQAEQHSAKFHGIDVNRKAFAAELGSYFDAARNDFAQNLHHFSRDGVQIVIIALANLLLIKTGNAMDKLAGFPGLALNKRQALAKGIAGIHLDEASLT